MKPMAGMLRATLGATGVVVSKLGFGTFDFGVPSLRINPEQGARILRRAHELGVTLWDTSDDYGSHAHVARALRGVARSDAVICTKTSARNGRGAASSLGRSLKELGTDYLDILLLHAVDASEGGTCRKVLKDLSRKKSEGVVRAVGLSTHSVSVVREAARFEDVDVIMAICYKPHPEIARRYQDLIPLEDGSMEEMLESLEMAHDNGKGVIAMKVLGNGAPPLVKALADSIRWVGALAAVDAMVVGMKSIGELEKNVAALAALAADHRRTRTRHLTGRL